MAHIDVPIQTAIAIAPAWNTSKMKHSMISMSFRYATILAFDVKIERDAQDLADNLGVKIFQADIIYHLFDKFTAYREELKQQKRDQFKSIAVFPCKLKVSQSIQSEFVCMSACDLKVSTQSLKLI
jgi:translation initiation factor 5B